MHDIVPRAFYRLRVRLPQGYALLLQRVDDCGDALLFSIREAVVPLLERIDGIDLNNDKFIISLTL